MREDIKRFIYMRVKLKKSGYPIKNTMPYPGYFLTGSLVCKIILTNIILFFRTLSSGKIKKAAHFLKNIILIFKYRKNASSDYLKFKKIENNWRNFMNWIDENRNDITNIIG